MRETLTFHVSTADRRRYRKLIYTSGLPRYYYQFMGLVLSANVLQLVQSLYRDRWSLDGVLFDSACLLVIFVCVIAILAIFFRRIPSEGTLSVSEVGFVGTIDKKPVALPWSRIASARDLDDAVIILRRGVDGPIAIPKADIADVSAFWAMLEEHLIAKRGLILSAAPRTRITNSAS